MRPLDPRLLRVARATRSYLVTTVTCGVVAAGLVIAQATLLADIIARVFYGADLDAVQGALLGLAVVLAARAGLAGAQEALAHHASIRVKAQLREALLARAVALGPRWLAGERSGELATLSLRGVDALDGYFARYLPALVLAAIVPTVVLVQLAVADTIAFVTVALTLPLIPLFMVLVGLATQHRTRKQWRRLEILGHHFLDLVQGLPTAKVFGRAKSQAVAVRRVADEHRQATMGTLRLAFLSSFVLELLAMLSVALVAVGIGLRLVNGELGLETALLVLILAPEAYLPLRQVGAQFHASAEGLAAAERVFAVLETPVSSPGGREPVPDLRRSTIRVDDVTVAYDGRDRPALDALTIALRPGEVVAVVGPSGAGKSTLLAALLGFVAPDTGRIRIGSVDLATVDIDAWRASVSWLPQRPSLLAGTIEDNVRLGRPEATADDVRQALRAANADFVSALPEDARTPLGEGGAGLSVGQRRRIALARALLRDAPVLLLDEPTAGLDADTEAETVHRLRDRVRSRTAVVVTQRPAVLALADRVVDLGEVATQLSAPDHAGASPGADNSTRAEPVP
ncbi:MAG: thiol reductant ABC exporter subunit CydD [Nocardioidaceae bacterium]